MSHTSLADQSLRLDRSQYPIFKKMQFHPDKVIWNKVAVYIGLFLLAAGIFGAIGLVHTYYPFLPTSLATKVITFLANTPYHWGIWTFAAGGMLLGIGIIAYNSYKIHQHNILEMNAKKEAQLDEDDVDTPSEQESLRSALGYDLDIHENFVTLDGKRSGLGLLDQ